jgi:adenosylcobinamide-GDP ribazoletransferase
MTGLRTALGFLTVAPAGQSPWTPERAAPWFPVVGAVLGAAAALQTAWWMWLVGGIAGGALAVAGLAVLTGGLHLDGLADSADAALSSADLERRRAVLADVHHGTFGTVTLILATLVAVGCLGGLGTRDAAVAIGAAVFSARCFVVAVMVRWKPWSDGLGARFAAGATPLTAATAAAAALCAWVFPVGLAGASAWAAGLGAAAGTGWFLNRRLGGVNGDGYGASMALSEVAMLAAFAIAQRHGLSGGLA